MAGFWVSVARIGELAPGQKKIVEVDGIPVVLINTNGEYFALEDVCTHDGGPLGEGPLQGHRLICPRHGAAFDVRNGAALKMPAVDAVPTYAVRIQGDEILIETA